MKEIRANGMLRHRFWGKYSAFIYLKFKGEQDALKALKILGGPWEQHDKAAQALCCIVDSEDLEEVENILAKYGADKEKISSTRYSIDYGEEFEVCFEVEDDRQLKLFE